MHRNVAEATSAMEEANLNLNRIHSSLSPTNVQPRPKSRPTPTARKVSRFPNSCGSKIRRASITASLCRVSGLVEKPKLLEAPSRMGIVGRYLMTPDLFDCIKRVSRSAQGEAKLTDAIRLLLRERDVCARVIEGKRYDTGDKIGYIKTVMDFAFEREDLRREIGQYLIEKISGPKGDTE